MYQACTCVLPNPSLSSCTDSPLTTSFKLRKCYMKPPKSQPMMMLHSHTNRWSLRGMTALVTGGTRGIGYQVFNFNAHPSFFFWPFWSLNPNLWFGVWKRHAIVEELMGFGARVHTCARNEDELSKCLKDWNDSGFDVTGSICDVSLPQQREALMEAVSSVFHGKLNILVRSSKCFIYFVSFVLFCIFFSFF